MHHNNSSSKALIIKMIICVLCVIRLDIQVPSVFAF